MSPDELEKKTKKSDCLTTIQNKILHISIWSYRVSKFSRNTVNYSLPVSQSFIRWTF